MLDDSDWIGIIVFVSLSVFVGSKAVSFSKTGEYKFLWGGWLWLPVFFAQGLGAFLMWRTNGITNQVLYEIAMVLYLVDLLSLLGVVFNLHHIKTPKATMVWSMSTLFSMITTTCMFFVSSRGAGFLYMTSLPWAAVVTYKTVEVALTKDSYAALHAQEVSSSSAPKTPPE